MLDMLIAIGLGLVILLPLAVVVRAAVVTHFRQQQIFVIEQDAHYLLDHMGRAIQQAGHNDPLDLADDSAVALRGLDNNVISGSSEDISVMTSSGFHGSDVLAIHFSSSSVDNNMILRNCAGFPVPPSHSMESIVGGVFFIWFVVRMSLVISAANIAGLINGIRNRWQVESSRFNFFMG